MSDKPETLPKKERAPVKGEPRQDARTSDLDVVFDLEKRYPEVSELFAPYSVSSTDKQDVMVSIDTNALLLPYSVGKSDLKAIADVYRRLAKEKRLFLSARATREFIKHRDRKLAEMIKALDGNFHVATPTMLESLSGYKSMIDAVKKVQGAQREYDKAKASVVAGIKSWRGNDPVSELYREVFGKDQIIEHDGDAADVAEEWESRQNSQIPPGYKDAHKEDSGIGDFLIWKSILKLGEERQRDQVFVTGERKADWFVRSSGEPVYPRPELVDEYRRFSKGHNIRLATLADLLSELHAPEAVVEEVRDAEVKANTAAQTSASGLFGLSGLNPSFLNERVTVQDFSELRPGTFGSIFLPDRRILYLPNVSPLSYAFAEDPLKKFRIPPLRRVISPQHPVMTYLEYDSALQPSQADAVLSFARMIDPGADWVSQQEIRTSSLY
jgi:hypothetical protein